ncbi:molybdopterin-guanine dinucleotide biosynthesis protein B [Alkalihalobacillus sp. NPDC078783]
MAVGIKPVIVQIVGFKNSGKTTLMNQLIQEAVNYKLEVGTIKHHGHGGVPDVPITQNDSARHFSHGATVSAVEGAGSLQLQASVPDGDLASSVQILENWPLDLILIEGYKQWAYPKIVLLRSEDDQSLLDLTHIVAVVLEDQMDLTQSYPAFLRDEKASYIPWIMDYIRRQRLND